MFRIAVVLLLQMSLCTFANETSEPMLLLEFPKLDLDNKEFYVDQMNKLTIQIISRHRGYQFFFSNQPITKNNARLNKLSIVVGRLSEKGLHYIDLKQTSGKTGQVLKKSWCSGIPERFILLQLRISLSEALYGKSIAMEEREKLMKSDGAFKEFVEKNQKSELEESEKRKGSPPAQDKSPSQKKKADTEELTEEERPDERSYQSSLDSPLSFPEYLDQLARSKNKTAQEILQSNNAQYDEIETTRKRIKERLKDQKVKNARSKTETEDRPNELESDLVANLPKVPRENTYGKVTRPRKSRAILDFVYLNRSLQSSYLIEVSNNFNFAGGRITYRQNLSDTRGDDLVFSFMNLKVLQINNVQYDIPDLRNAHFQYLSDYYFLPFDVLFGLHYDNQFFINLPTMNEGLKVAENQLVWAQMGVERTFQIGRFLVSFQALYAQNIYSKSNFLDDRNIMLEAHRTNLGIDVTYKKMAAGVQFSKEEITSSSLSNFKVSQNSFYFNFAYMM